MPGILKRWQTKIEIYNPRNIYTRELVTIYLYGETIEHLRLAVQTQLRKINPLSFNNVGDYITGKLIYFYKDKQDPYRFSSNKASQNLLEEGWWYKKVGVGNDQSDIDYEKNPRKLIDFSDAIEHFTKFALIPEKG